MFWRAMASSSKRRRLDYDPSDPDIQLGPLNLQEMLLFLRQVWKSLMRDSWLTTLHRVRTHHEVRSCETHRKAWLRRWNAETLTLIKKSKMHMKTMKKHKHMFVLFVVRCFLEFTSVLYETFVFVTIAKHVPAIWWHWHFLELPRHSLDASSTMGSPRSKFLELPRRFLDVSSNTSAPHEAAFNTFSSCWWKSLFSLTNKEILCF